LAVILSIWCLALTCYVSVMLMETSVNSSKG